MSNRIKIGERIKGSFNQTEDWWYLVTEDDGTKYVEHEWDHADPYKGKGSADKERIEVKDFLDSSANEGIKAKLREALKGEG